jgi:cation diffusion facilitator CzcD-associated flavoprotein CzcO
MKHGQSARVCIIGAGPSGITAAKHLLQVEHTNFVIYEKKNQVGGIWVYSSDTSQPSIYESAHLITSKLMSQYPDYPMPDDYPDYPSHKLLLKYFQGYAEHFGVVPYIEFETCVASAIKQSDETWEITLDDGRIETFDYLIVANGHHWNPRLPDYDGDFTGEFIHSNVYRTPIPYRGKRVLVVGGGNSACDIAVDIGRHAEFTAISWRRGYYVVPKFMFGVPPDEFNAKTRWIPTWIHKRLNFLTWYLLTGGNKKHGLPVPEHSLTESHPVINSNLLYHIRHGDIHPRPDIQHFEGQMVYFTDGRAEEYDTVIVSTGYQITFPFFEDSFIDYANSDVDLYLRIFHANHPSLMFMGLIQAQGCLWTLVDVQAQLVAKYIMGNYQVPDDMEAEIQKEVAHIKDSYSNTIRHSSEVNYHMYRKQLLNEMP